MSNTNKIEPPICPYCGATSNCVDSSVIYGRSYGPAWVCANYPKCDSYVGCHPGGERPLGRLANKELRLWKKNAHSVFDSMWKRFGWMRTEAYEWLAKQLSIHPMDCHIGMFDVDKCKAVVESCDRYILEVI